MVQSFTDLLGAMKHLKDNLPSGDLPLVDYGIDFVQQHATLQAKYASYSAFVSGMGWQGLDLNQDLAIWQQSISQALREIIEVGYCFDQVDLVAKYAWYFKEYFLRFCRERNYLSIHADMIQGCVDLCNRRTATLKNPESGYHDLDHARYYEVMAAELSR